MLYRLSTHTSHPAQAQPVVHRLATQLAASPPVTLLAQLAALHLATQQAAPRLQHLRPTLPRHTPSTRPPPSPIPSLSTQSPLPVPNLAAAVALLSLSLRLRLLLSLLADPVMQATQAQDQATTHRGPSQPRHLHLPGLAQPASAPSTDLQAPRLLPQFLPDLATLTAGALALLIMVSLLRPTSAVTLPLMPAFNNLAAQPKIRHTGRGMRATALQLPHHP